MNHAARRLKDLALVREQAQKDELRAQDEAGRARQKLDLLRRREADDQKKLLDVSARYRVATERMARLREHEEQEGALRRTRDDLARLPADAEARAQSARDAVEDLTALGQALQTLGRLAAKRGELCQATRREEEADRALQALKARGEKARDEQADLAPKVKMAADQAREAADRSAEARTRLRQARDALQELDQLRGSKRCRHCGQALTEGHITEERRRRAGEVGAAEQAVRDAAEAVRVAQDEEKALRAALTAAEERYQEARSDYKVGLQEEKQARQDVDRLRQECAAAYGDLPEPHRGRVAPSAPEDWLKTTFPTAADLDALRARAGTLPAARAELRQAEEAVQQARRLRDREAACLDALRRLQKELPADLASVRQDFEALGTEEKALKDGLEVRRLEVQEVDGELRRLEKKREEAQAELSKADRSVQQQELIQQNARQQTDKTRQQLPAAWQKESENVGLSSLSGLRQERQELESRGTDEREKQLERARRELDDLRESAAALADQQDSYPAEARAGVAAVKAKFEEARQAQQTREKEALGAAADLRRLEDRQQERQQVEKDCLAVARELQAEEILAKLLGRDRLQLHLVRQAERQVVEYANGVLDRLSGGQLYLRLTGQAEGDAATTKALELEAFNRVTGEKPINVAFLSGSQKFRVAVSLALGIGQYASRSHRPIESVIIDEGFGCLDRHGRQVMIQELQNLRGQMRCILLVSHQEEFADAFSDGYHFELEAGATRVKRIQR
jgi:DNA repair exonuclease SbcCD ATPase subunit